MLTLCFLLVNLWSFVSPKSREDVAIDDQTHGDQFLILRAKPSSEVVLQFGKIVRARYLQDNKMPRHL